MQARNRAINHRHEFRLTDKIVYLTELKKGMSSHGLRTAYFDLIPPVMTVLWFWVQRSKATDIPLTKSHKTKLDPCAQFLSCKAPLTTLCPMFLFFSPIKYYIARLEPSKNQLFPKTSWLGRTAQSRDFWVSNTNEYRLPRSFVSSKCIDFFVIRKAIIWLLTGDSLEAELYC